MSKLNKAFESKSYPYSSVHPLMQNTWFSTKTKRWPLSGIGISGRFIQEKVSKSIIIALFEILFVEMSIPPVTISLLSEIIVLA